MMIAHLPAGYLLSTALSKKWRITNDQLHKYFILAGISGSIFPDIDIIYFYLVDNKQHHHHSFFTHYPILWVALIIISYLFLKNNRLKSFGLIAMIFSINGFLHMMLDSLVGDIRWLTPFSNQAFSLFDVAATHAYWWLNFIFHWSFLVELLIVVIGIYVYRNRKLKKIAANRRRDAFMIAI